MKSLFKSKTFWFNVIMGGVTIASGGAAIPVISGVLESSGVASAIAAHPAVVAGITAGANVALRMVTSQPVSVTGQ